MVRTGEEFFTFNNKNTSINVLSFWQWSSSDLLTNVIRGKLAEFIVASSIDLIDNEREEWDAYDLITEKGLKIEIKSSAYIQSWDQSKLSKIIFGIIATAVGISNALSIIPDISKIAPHVLWNGLKTSLVTTFSGGFILLFSTALWYFFSYKYKQHTL